MSKGKLVLVTAIGEIRFCIATERTNGVAVSGSCDPELRRETGADDIHFFEIWEARFG